jgi:hypothetical protein
MSLGGPRIYPGIPSFPYLPAQEGGRNPQQDLETEPRADPVHGWKGARIIARRGGLMFTGIGDGMFSPYTAEAVMSCSFFPVHRVPAWHGSSLGHGCGFYAWTRRPQVVAASGIACLEVEHYGTVIQHELGTRAQKQRVLSVRLQACSPPDDTCGNIPVLLQQEDRSLLLPQPSAALYPVCRDHAAWPHPVFTFAEASGLLGTEIRAGIPEGQ